MFTAIDESNNRKELDENGIRDTAILNTVVSHVDAPRDAADTAEHIITSAARTSLQYKTQLWINLPLMLTVLAFGTAGIYLGSSIFTTYLPWLLPIGYAAGVVLWTLLLAQGAHREGWNAPLRPGRDAWLLFTGGFLVDMVFLTGIIILTGTIHSIIYVALLGLSLTRLLQEPPRLWTPYVLLSVPVPIIAFGVQFVASGEARQVTFRAILSVAVVVSSALLVVYALVLKRRAKEAELAEALIERDRRLEESRSTLKQTSKYLAEQLLRLDLLQDGIRAINSTVELDSLLQMIVNNTRRVLKVDQSSIGLIDEQTGDLVIRSIAGIDGFMHSERRFKLGVGVAGWVALHGKPLLIKDVRKDPRFIDFYKNESNREDHVRSMLCVPLIVEQDLIGIICVTRFGSNSLTRLDESLLTSFAEQAALAVHKSQLLEARARQRDEIKQHVEMLSTLHSITEGALSSLDLPQVLDTVTTRISELLSIDYSAIYLVNEYTGEEEQAASVGERAMCLTNAELREGALAMDLWKRARATGMPHWSNSADSMLCLPLIDRTDAIGCILLAREGHRPFSEEERNTADRLAYAATIAVVNARLFARVSAQQKQFAALYRLTTAMNSSTNRRYLAKVICRELHGIVNASASALLALDRPQRRFAAWAARGAWEDANLERVALPMQHDPFISEVLTTLHEKGDPSLLLIHKAPYQVTQAFNSATAVTIPLVVGSRLFGLFTFEPGAEPPLSKEIKETVGLAVSNSAMALERAELFEQKVTAARQSGLLYKFAAQAQPLSDPAAVTQLTADYLLKALPLRACEVYLFTDSKQKLSRVSMAVARRKHGSVTRRIRGGPDSLSASDVDIVEALTSANLVAGAAKPPKAGARRARAPRVVLARLMGSTRPLGIVRLITSIPTQEFVHRHSTFCQTLLTHAEGALERSKLYSTVVNQTRLLRRTQQHLSDLIDMGRLSSANTPVADLLHEIADRILRSLGVSYVRLGEICTGSDNAEIWALADGSDPARSHKPPKVLSAEDIERLMEVGQPTNASKRSVYLDEAALNHLLPEQPNPLRADAEHKLILMALETASKQLLGYIIAPAGEQDSGETDISNSDRLDVMSLLAQRTSLLIENRLVYNQLLESKREIDAVVLAISDAVIVTDNNLEVLITNSLADQLLGISEQSAPGASIRLFAKGPELASLIHDCIAGAKIANGEVEFSVGHDRWIFEATAHPILNEQAEVTGAVLTMWDVTTQRMLERAKSDFLSIVSHELRTPINSVLGFLDILLSGKTGVLNDLQTDFLTTARQEGVVLNRLISDLLDYSQLQSGMLRMEAAPTDLSFLIGRLVTQRAARSSEPDKIKFVSDVPLGIIVMGDEIRLAQVFNNLLDNALKFTEAGEITIGCRIKADDIIISVADTGCGIAPSQVSAIFDRFFQADNNNNHSRRGLGLGLAICKSIVEAHGGEIWARSEPSVGTTIFVKLPIVSLRDAGITLAPDIVVHKMPG